MTEPIENCPFPDCQTECRIIHEVPGAYVECGRCGYESGIVEGVDNAIAAHNSLCRKLRFAEEAEGALRFYANPDSYCNGVPGEDQHFRDSEDEFVPDKGNRARAALKLLEGEDG